MRVLIITPTPTHPTTQGNRARVFQIACALKQQGATVDLLYYAIDGLDPGSVEAMREAWDTVYVVGLNGFKALRGYPAYWGVDDWISPGLFEAARTIANAVRYDAVIVNYVWLSLLFAVFGDSTLRILDTHDAFGGRRELALSVGIRPHWFYTSVEQEALGLDRADLVLAIQPEEGRYFSGISTSPVETVEYAITPSFLPARPLRPHQPLTVGYLGSGNPWNVTAVAAMEAAVLAQCHGNVPRSEVRFLLFGGITKSAGTLRVFESCGVVDEVRDAYMAMDIVINPMVGGTGLKIKTVEALAYGRAVISTKAGASGLGIAHHDLLHEDIESLVGRVLAIVEHPEEAAAISAEMQASYMAYYQSVTANLAQLLRRIA